MRKKAFSFILCMAIIINLFTVVPITTYAFDRTTYNSLCPITIYPCTDDADFPAYTTVECTTKSGRIYRTDRCTIIKFYKNSNGDDVCKVKYPVSGGGTKTAYAKTSRFIHDKSFSPAKKTITAKTNVAAYAGASAISGWYISSGDKIYVLGRDGNGNTQVAYPVDDGYKVAWIKYYTVKYNANGGSNAPGTQYKTQNANLTLTSSKPSRTGYTFNSWNTGKSGGGTKYSSGGTYKSNSSDTLYAQWTINSYKLTVSSANTSMGTVSGGGTYNYGSSATLKATPKTGHSFVKWSDGNTSATRTVSVTKAATYTATFKVNSYSVTTNSTNNSMGTASGGGTYSYGSSISIKANPASHYHFVKWSDGNTSNPRTITVGASNATYTAVFAIDTHTITVNSENTTKGTVSGGGTYNYSSKIVINAYPKDEYKFTKWSDGNTSQSREISVTGNATYTAYFEYNPDTCNHNYSEWQIVKAASCIATGEEIRTCSKCNTTEKAIIGLKSHQYNDEWIVDTDATCEEDGLKHQNCYSCGEATISEVIPKLGHDFSLWETTQAPSCTENGIKGVFCSRCSEIDPTQSEIIEATGHSYGAWIIDKSALCDESGLKHRECSVCGSTEEETIDEIGHQFIEQTVDPVGTNPGLIIQTCENIIDGTKCSKSVVTTYYPTIYAGNLTTKNFYAKQGDTLSIPVILSDNPGFLGFEITMKYDSNILTPLYTTYEKLDTIMYQYAKTGTAIPNASFTTTASDIIDTENGTDKMITVSYTNSTAIYNNGTLFYIDFTVNDNISTGVISPIVISYNTFVGEELTLSISPTIENGIVFTTSEDSSEVIRGDALIDGIVDIRDNILISRYIVGVETLSERQLTAADVYKDSKINTKDTVRLSQLIVGWNFDETESISLFSTTTPIFSVGKCTAEADGYVDVPITISNNSGIAGFHLNLSFDNDYIYPVSVSANGIIGEDSLTTNIQEDVDTSTLEFVSLQWSEADNLIVDGTVCTIKFKVKDTVSNGQIIPIELSNVVDDPVCVVSGTEINDISAEMNNGSVTIENTASDEGMKYKIEGVTYTLTDGTESDIIPVNTEFNATVNFIPLTDELTLGTVIIAMYDSDNRFIGIQSKEIDLKMLMNEAYTFTIPKYNNIAKISVYIWDSLNTLKPLSNKFEQ